MGDRANVTTEALNRSKSPLRSNSKVYQRDTPCIQSSRPRFAEVVVARIWSEVEAGVGSHTEVDRRKVAARKAAARTAVAHSLAADRVHQEVAGMIVEAAVGNIPLVGLARLEADSTVEPAAAHYRSL